MIDYTWSTDIETEMCENCGNDWTDHCPYCHGCWEHQGECE